MDSRFSRLAFGGNGDDAAQSVGARQSGMGRHHDLQIGDNGGRKGRDFAGLQIDMQGHIFGAGGKPALRRVVKFRPEMDSLAVIIDQLDGGTGRHIHK